MRAILIISLIFSLVACQSAPSKEQVNQAVQGASQILQAIQPLLEMASASNNFCDVAPCDECNPGGSITILDENGRPKVIPQCPEDSGWLCCDESLTVCVGIQGEPDDSCQGGYIWCDYYETDASGFAECWDEFGQGIQPGGEEEKE